MPHYPVSSKPRFGEMVAPSHPLAAGLVGAFPLSEAFGLAVNNLGSRRGFGTFSGAANQIYWSPSWTGIGIDVASPVVHGAGAGYIALPALGLSGNPPWTVVARFCCERTPPNGDVVWGWGTAGVAASAQLYLFSATSLRLHFFYNGTGNELAATVPSMTNQIITVAATWNPQTSKRTLFLNGAQVGQDNPGFSMTFLDQNYALLWDLQNTKFIGDIDYCFFYNRVLSNAEIAALGIDPFQMWHPITRPVPWVNPGISITPGAGSLTLTGYAPTAIYARRITPGAGSLTLTGYAPTARTSIRVTPGTGTFALAGYAPTLRITRLVTPGKGTLTLTGYAPSAVIGSPILKPGTAALTLTGYAPRVFPMKLTPGTGSLVLTGYAPRLVFGRAQPGAGSLVLTGYAPTLASGTPKLAPGTGALTLTGYAPTIAATSLILTWNVTRLLNAPLPLEWSVVSQLLASSLALQWNITATLAAFGLSWRVLADVFTPFGINRATGQSLGGTSGDIQKPVATVTKTP